MSRLHDLKKNAEGGTIEHVMSELGIATRTGMCPYCGTELVVSFDAWSEGLKCPECSWACGMSLGWEFGMDEAMTGRRPRARTRNPRHSAGRTGIGR